jgi:hypothetical protein
MKAAALVLLWANCVERLKDRVNNRSFWMAVENCQPIALESDFLILGLAPEHYHLATHMQQVSHAHVVAQTVQELFNQPLQVRVIEGTSPKDWEATKEHDARVAALRQAATTREIRRDVHAQGWEGVYESIARLYMQTPLRSLPQGKARYVNDALYTLAEAMDTLYPESPDEATERSVARILDRIANASDMPATTLAFELERLRAWRKAGTESADGAEDAQATAPDHTEATKES